MSTAAPPVSAAPLAGAPADAALPAAPPADAAPPVSVGAAAAVHCQNCGAEVSGRYCATCGQRREPPLHSLWHFAKVTTEDLTHADSRVWRTLAALLFRPGYLTREFLAGRRARYLPPVRLYLVLSVAFFLCAAVTHDQLQVLQITEPGSGPPSMRVTPLTGTDQSPFGARPEESLQQRTEQCRHWDYQGPWEKRLAPALHQACVRIAADNGRSLQQAFLHNLGRAMFLFLPLLAGAMMLMYWRPRHYYVEHLLLFVHNHAFVFLVVLLMWALAAIVPRAAGWLHAAVSCYVVWYLFRSMRVVYGQGRWLTFGKLVLLSFFYLVSGAVMLALTTVYSMFTL